MSTTDIAALVDSVVLTEAANRLRFERTPYCEKLADACDDAAAALESLQARVQELERCSANLAVYPDECPITGRPFFMTIEHPDIGIVPTYGGPFDSYTIPQSDTPPPCKFEVREFYVHRYDHDRGGWVEDEGISHRVILEDDVYALQDRAEKAEAERDAFKQDAERMEYLESLRNDSLLEYEGPSRNIIEPRRIVLNDDNDERLGSGATVREAIDDAMRSCPSGTNGSLDLVAERAAIDAAKEEK